MVFQDLINFPFQYPWRQSLNCYQSYFARSDSTSFSASKFTYRYIWVSLQEGEGDYSREVIILNISIKGGW